VANCTHQTHTSTAKPASTSHANTTKNFLQSSEVVCWMMHSVQGPVTQAQPAWSIMPAPTLTTCPSACECGAQAHCCINSSHSSAKPDTSSPGRNNTPLAGESSPGRQQHAQRCVNMHTLQAQTDREAWHATKGRPKQVKKTQSYQWTVDSSTGRVPLEQQSLCCTKLPLSHKHKLRAAYNIERHIHATGIAHPTPQSWLVHCASER
jgi:hypothetical protein